MNSAVNSLKLRRCRKMASASQHIFREIKVIFIRLPWKLKMYTILTTVYLHKKSVPIPSKFIQIFTKIVKVFGCRIHVALGLWRYKSFPSKLQIDGFHIIILCSSGQVGKIGKNRWRGGKRKWMGMRSGHRTGKKCLPPFDLRFCFTRVSFTWCISTS